MSVELTGGCSPDSSSRALNLGCLSASSKVIVGETPMNEWIPLLSAHKKSEKYLLINLSNLVKLGTWKENNQTGELIQQAIAELNKRKLSSSSLKTFKRIERVYQIATEELRECSKQGLTVTRLEGAPAALLRPQFKVVRFTPSNYPRLELLDLLHGWRKQVRERALLAEVLKKIGLLPEKKADLADDSKDIMYSISAALPKKIDSMKEVYVAYDDKNVPQGVAMCWAEGVQGYHLKYPVTAPDNLEVLSCGKFVTRGAMSAIVAKMAEDVLQKIQEDPKTVAPRLFCNPYGSAVPFYKKLGFVDTSNNISDSESESDVDSDTDSESDSDCDIDELEMDEEAMQALVEKAKPKQAISAAIKS